MGSLTGAVALRGYLCYIPTDHVGTNILWGVSTKMLEQLVYPMVLTAFGRSENPFGGANQQERVIRYYSSSTTTRRTELIVKMSCPMFLFKTIII